MAEPNTDFLETPVAPRLIREALNLFERRGYDATSVQEIVDAADVTKGAFYHYFKSKDELLRLIIEEYLDRQIAEMVDICGSDASIRAKISRVVHTVIGSLPEHQKSMSVFLRERRSLSTASMDSLAHKRDRYAELFAAMISDGMRSGQVKLQADPNVVAFGIVGMCVWAHEWYSSSGTASVEQIAQWYCDMVLDGLAADPPGTTTPAG